VAIDSANSQWRGEHLLLPAADVGWPNLLYLVAHCSNGLRRWQFGSFWARLASVTRSSPSLGCCSCCRQPVEAAETLRSKAASQFAAAVSTEQVTRVSRGLPSPGSMSGCNLFVVRAVELSTYTSYMLLLQQLT
jgi:hypothetical protein